MQEAPALGADRGCQQVQPSAGHPGPCPDRGSATATHHDQDLSLDEVCEILNINKNAAKVNLSLARKRMRRMLLRCGLGGQR